MSQPGSTSMPPWNKGKLPEPPTFAWRKILAMLGPGLFMAGAAIGGGEWLTGPVVTARYGGAMLWLATLSILGQVVYNVEVSRYTLYTGEPIFAGKFRTLPGPRFWLVVYLCFDIYMFFPFLAAAGATPLLAMIRGEIPNPSENPADEQLLRGISIALFLLSLAPLIVGGKVYNSIKVLMTIKIVLVMGFLVVLAVLFATPQNWWEVGTGFLKFGTLPVAGGEQNVPQVGNLFVDMLQGKALPAIDWTMIGFLCALVAISGNGGLGNSAVSNYTREQGWGMGAHVGAIPSLVGGRNIQLSHVGTVFEPTVEALERWRKWFRHVVRDQWGVWMPGCFVGVGLPAMMSLMFLPRGFFVDDQWRTAVITADGIRDAISGSTGNMFWMLTLFCGFMVLFTGVTPAADGFLRRWVDVIWIASPRARKLDPAAIRYVYFGVLTVYAVFGVFMLTQENPTTLLFISALISNFALGFSCMHTLFVNLTILPRELRPGWFCRSALFLAAIFFLAVGVMATCATLINKGYL